MTCGLFIICEWLESYEDLFKLGKKEPSFFSWRDNAKTKNCAIDGTLLSEAF